MTDLSEHVDAIAVGFWWGEMYAKSYIDTLGLREYLKELEACK